MEIVWSKAALQRVEAIGVFIAKDSPPSASKFIDQLIHSVDRLIRHPLSGSVVPENVAFREVVFKKYRVIYRLMGETVQVVTVISPGLETDKLLK
ncbi:MAG TPA: type II toxin-antitoxin system RelE/ParE family toxin [Bdellovibrionota bacterium]|nr:type II toxin-antitoxin system RelE/ParE family toxin [Bdellovibrionota bacterium]